MACSLSSLPSSTALAVSSRCFEECGVAKERERDRRIDEPCEIGNQSRHSNALSTRKDYRNVLLRQATDSGALSRPIFGYYTHRRLCRGRTEIPQKTGNGVTSEAYDRRLILTHDAGLPILAGREPRRHSCWCYTTEAVKIVLRHIKAASGSQAVDDVISHSMITATIVHSRSL